MTVHPLVSRLTLVTLLLIAIPVCARPVAAPFDYSALEKITILNDARTKPLDTFARETLRLITSREYWSESKAPHPFLARDPMTNLLSMLFEPDKWKDIPCIYLANAEVKQVLGVDPLSQWISYNQLRSNSDFRTAFEEVMRKQQMDEKITPAEHHLGDLHGVLNRMDGIFYGSDIKIVPVQTGSELTWIALNELAGMKDLGSLSDCISEILTAFTTGDTGKFTNTVQELTTQLRTRGGNLYPAEKVLGYEITYNKTKPFRKAWIFLLLGTLLFAVAMGVTSQLPYYAAWAFTVIGFGLSSYGLLLRVLVAGRPPVSNMYESVIYMGWGVLLFAGIFELIYRQRIFGVCGAAMGVVVLTLADMLPFDPAISPLVPVLRSNYWLLVHVLTIVISYSAFALAMAIAHLSLCLYLFTPHKRDLIRTTNIFVYRAIQVGVLLLTIGTLLGGVWANESWGRFWGWDPKETWALISIVGYLVLLHARFFGLVGPFGIAVGAVVGFQLILMTWYGVNFILASGLHSYGFGAGGMEYVVFYLVSEAVFLGMVAVRYKLSGAGLKQVLHEESERSKMMSKGEEVIPQSTEP